MVAVCDRGRLVENAGEVVGRIGVGVDVVGDFVQLGKNLFVGVVRLAILSSVRRA